MYLVLYGGEEPEIKAGDQSIKGKLVNISIAQMGDGWPNLVREAKASKRKGIQASVYQQAVQVWGTHETCHGNLIRQASTPTLRLQLQAAILTLLTP